MYYACIKIQCCSICFYYIVCICIDKKKKRWHGKSSHAVMDAHVYSEKIYGFNIL